jgi:hypothetical protein
LFRRAAPVVERHDALGGTPQVGDDGGQADTPSGPSDHGAALLFARPEARLCSI